MELRFSQGTVMLNAGSLAEGASRLPGRRTPPAASKPRAGRSRRARELARIRPTHPAVFVHAPALFRQQQVRQEASAMSRMERTGIRRIAKPLSASDRDGGRVDRADRNLGAGQ